MKTAILRILGLALVMPQWLEPRTKADGCLLHHQGTGRYGEQDAGCRSHHSGDGHWRPALLGRHHSPAAPRALRRRQPRVRPVLHLQAPPAKLRSPAATRFQRRRCPPVCRRVSTTRVRPIGGYYIVSGEGTIVTGGHIISNRTSAPDAGSDDDPERPVVQRPHRWQTTSCTSSSRRATS